MTKKTMEDAVRELKGVLPPQVYFNRVCGYYRPAGEPSMVWYMPDAAIYLDSEIQKMGTVAEFEAEARRMGYRDAPEWRGPEDGLPPIGAEVEVVDDGTLRYGHGESGPVIAHAEDTAVVRMSYGLGCFRVDSLRPLRTDRERWVDAAEKRLVENRGNLYFGYRNIIGDIYDALVSRDLPVPEARNG